MNRELSITERWELEAERRLIEAAATGKPECVAAAKAALEEVRNAILASYVECRKRNVTVH
jgi:hypothetical protein